MTSIFWDEATPSNTSDVRDGDDTFRNLKAQVRAGIDGEHHWTGSAGTNDRGLHRKGSARAYLDAQSNLSDSGVSAAGKLYVASDSSRLFATPDSGLTMFLGGSFVPEVIAYGPQHDAVILTDNSSNVTRYTQNVRTVMEVGAVIPDANDSIVTFAHTYEVAPFVLAVAKSTTGGRIVTVKAISTQSFSMDVRDVNGSRTTDRVMYQSIGTIPF